MGVCPPCQGRGQGIKTVPCSPRVGRVFSSTSVWKNGKYSRTSTISYLYRNGHLSATATFFVLADGHSYFNLSRMATSTQWQQPLKHVPTAKITSLKWPVNQQLTNPVYKIPFFIGHGHETWSIPRIIGLYFCLVSVLSIYFDCVTYLHVTLSIFLKIKIVNPKKISVSHFTPTDTVP